MFAYLKPPQPSHLRTAQHLAGLVVLIASVSVVGHATGVPLLASWLPQHVTMKVETAALLAALAVSLAEYARGRTRFARGALVVAAIPIGYLVGVYLGAFPPFVCSGGECHNGHPLHLRAGSPLTLVMGCFDWIAIFATTSSQYRIARWVEAGTVLGSAVAFGFAAWGAGSFADLTGTTGAAVPTAVAFTCLTVGTFVAAAPQHIAEVTGVDRIVEETRELREQVDQAIREGRL